MYKIIIYEQVLFCEKCCLNLNQNYSDENLKLSLKRIFKIIEKEFEYFSKNK